MTDWDAEVRYRVGRDYLAGVILLACSVMVTQQKKKHRVIIGRNPHG